MSRELDAEVAEKVMGLSLTPIGGFQVSGDRTPAYSTDIDAAWMVVERMLELGYGCELRGYGSVGSFHGHPHDAVFILNGNHTGWKAETMPLAICKAAIEAMGGKVMSQEKQILVYGDDARELILGMAENIEQFSKKQNNWFTAKTYNTDLVIDGMRIQFAPCAEELARKSMDAAGL